MPTAKTLINRAIDLSDAEDYTGAISLLTQAIGKDSSNPQAYFERGMAYLGLERKSDAVADFDQALAIDPKFPGARKWRADTLQSLGGHEEAAKEYLKDLRANPRGKYGMGVNPLSWAECAEAFVDAGKHARARKLLEEYFGKHVGKVEVEGYACYETAPMRLFAGLLVQSGDFARACEFGKQAYDSEHQCPADIVAYALALEAAGKRKRASKICEEALDANSSMQEAQELQKRLKTK